MEQRNEIKRAGLKVTLPRLKILEILEMNPKKHMSAEDIYKETLKADEDIGLATVYRVLTQFESAGLVIRHNFEGGHSVFEVNDCPHHHMVCVETGKVTEFNNAEIDAIQEKVASEYGYDLIDRNIVLYVKPKK